MRRSSQLQYNMLAITTYATKNYTYAIKAQIPLFLASIKYAGIKEFKFIFVGDDSLEVDRATYEYCQAVQSVGGVFTRLVLPVTDNGNKLHEKNSNIMIAKMQEAAWAEALKQGATLCWSLESDILPSPKALQCLIDVIAFDKGWYDIAMATYPNSGFLGGRASPTKWILPNIYEDERIIPDVLKCRLDVKEARLTALKAERKSPNELEIAEWQLLEKELEACPPKDNVWNLNGTNWKPRGWFDYAYPGIGKGAILPTDWVGLGCTLLSEKALHLASFAGYDGGGTQDLWLCWRAWHPEGLSMAVTSHALCSHVKKVADKDEYSIMFARHELGGPQNGHLRVETRPWTP